MPNPTPSTDLPHGHRIGRYVVTRRLGRGGMGVVYAARDERLGRDVALKLMSGLADDSAVQRFWREARAAASINHPHVCQLYEVDEAAEGIFLAMELLSGEPLDAHLARGPLPPADAVRIAVEMLAALGALHARGFVHRDVKPSNVFVTEHGAKLLDFGLARSALPDTVRLDSTPRDDVTAAGMIVGTPRYMAPEQVQGDSIDGRTDLYAVGAVLFEMLSGRPPFIGENIFDLLYATLHEQPPALQGPPAVIAADRVIRRAMAKRPADRPADADAMAAELRGVASLDASGSAAIPVRALTRLVVPPLRLARPDAEIDFLSLGLAETVSATLAGLGDLVVRAPGVGARLTGATPDLRRLAADADVDLVVMGSLLRSGAQLRATVQLVDALSGTVLGAESTRGSLDDVFAFEDALGSAVCQLVTKHLGRDAAAPARDVPATARAFELYLRGNDTARTPTRMLEARDRFAEAVREDPGFAPAWAMLGRAHRFIGKFIEQREENERRAEDALRRALALNPNQSGAHRYLTYIEAEHGRADAAIARLLGQARVARNDAQIFAGLVHACRYAGLTDASLAAHREARRLDPNISTSVEYTIALTSDPALMPSYVDFVPGSTEHLGALIATHFRTDTPALRAALRGVDMSRVPAGFQATVGALHAVWNGPRDDAMRALAFAVDAHVDPEAWYMCCLGYARIEAIDFALPLLERIIATGFTPTATLETEPLFDGMRADPRFIAAVEDSQRRTTTARLVFERGGGPELLGVPGGA